MTTQTGDLLVERGQERAASRWVLARPCAAADGDTHGADHRGFPGDEHDADGAGV